MLSAAGILGIIIACGLASPIVALVSATTVGMTGVIWALVGKYLC
jgi:hypothetical protein